MLRIHADFNSMTADGTKVYIHVRDLRNELQPGLHVLLYEPNDFQVEAVIELNKDEDGTEWWLGVPDWTTCQDL